MKKETNKHYRLPDWNQFEEMVNGIWEREYYTNHGPLLVRLENELEKFFGVKNVICMTNSGIALMISVLASGANGNALIPALSHVNIAQSVLWAGLGVDFCDIKSGQSTIDPIEVKKKLNGNTGLIIVVNPFGGACDMEELESVARERNIKLIFISSSVFGQKYKGKMFGNFGNLEIFSFHESQLVNGADGACVCTNDDALAARLRNIRSSYGAGKPVEIPYTGNGRMSEIQAGLILLSLNEIEKNKSINREIYLNLKKRSSVFSIFEPSSYVTDLNYSELLIQSEPDKSEGTIDFLNMPGIAKNDFSHFGIDPFTGMKLQGFKNLDQFRNKSLSFSSSSILKSNDLS